MPGTANPAIIPMKQYFYNIDQINASIIARRRIVSACRECARKYSPFTLPDFVTNRICSRRKLYNFLEALDLPIAPIMHAYGLSVPRDTKLKASPGSYGPKQEEKPHWLTQVNVIVESEQSDDLDINI